MNCSLPLLHIARNDTVIAKDWQLVKDACDICATAEVKAELLNT